MAELKIPERKLISKSYRWDEDQWAKITAEAKRLGVTQNKFVRAVLEAYFAEKEKEKEF